MGIVDEIASDFLEVAALQDWLINGFPVELRVALEVAYDDPMNAEKVANARAAYTQAQDTISRILVFFDRYLGVPNGN